MKALVLRESPGTVILEERPDLEPGDGEVVVRLRAAALNRRDFWITRGLYPGVRVPTVLGSDGAGVVSSTGSGVPPSWRGREVVINPALGWGDDSRVQADGFRILGMPDDGTFATQVAVPATQLHPKPAHLSWEEAAALPLAGLTAYRAAFTQGGLEADETVLVTGIGGGVAVAALQLAVARGAKVVVTSSSEEKIARAVALGAAGGVLYTASEWTKRLTSEHGPVDLAIDGAGGKGYSGLIDVAANGGRIVSYGATSGPAERLDLFRLFWKQLRLMGSTMGSPADFEAMLDFVHRQEITPVVDRSMPLEEGAAAVELMKTSPQLGKIVLRMPD